MIRGIIVSIFLLVCLVGHTQEVWMHPNEGQWDKRVEYKIDLQLGEMYIEKDGFTFFLNNAAQKVQHSHGEEGHEEDNHEENQFQAHVIQSKFIGSTWDGNIIKEKPSTFYRNYILGNDPTKWKGKLYSNSLITMTDFYDGIDLKMDGSQGDFKYSLIVQPNVDVDQIIINYDGQDNLYIDDEGNLHIANRFGEIIESAPIAWTETNTGTKKVKIEFKIEGTKVFFNFPNGYDNSKTLVIDPSLTFSTFSGSSADNWGFTAAPDAAGNLFGGGVVMNVGYPITAGSYDPTFNGGYIDLGITKFDIDGVNLIYSTYIGGTGSETPNSIVCSQTDELFIFGITSSPDFPMAGAPYDNSFNGGPAILNSVTNNLGFDNGADLYVARLSADGTSLLSSTYIGGSNTDGLNTSNLKFNYGDQFRGDIVLDNNGSVYVSSMTMSPDFPIVLGSQPALNGSQDAVLFKMPIALNTLNWSTYFGGGGIETGNSIQIASNGDVYVAGGTTSGALSFNIGADLTYGGGLSDGYVTRFNGANGGVISGSFIGLAEYDQAYFVELDIDDNVYILGQTETIFSITPGHYGTPNSGQFIRKFNSLLTTELWTTMIGAGTGHVEISPTAFLVSDCYDIYLSGWGGNLNANAAVSQAVNSTTNGFPVTSGPNNSAYQPTTNGSNFYIAVLDQDAMNLKYGTYFGGTVSSFNHVDGGTSRFDKSGRIYHAVCGSCGNGVNNGFTTTPGVWSPLSQSTNCNMAAFKFELSTIEAVIGNPSTIVCIPDPVIFNNNSSNGNAFYWDFGDNTTSTDVNPTHYYSSPGSYTVSLVVSDTNGCYTPDSIEFIIDIGDFVGGVIDPTGAICPGDSYQLEAFGGVDYLWSPAQYLDDPTIATPIATVNQTTDFMVIVSDSCGVDTVYLTLPVFIGVADVSNDTSVCIGNSVDLYANGGASYVWSPGTYLDDPLSSTPTSTPTQDITYFVEITTSNGCLLYDTVNIDVYFTPPVPVMPDSVQLCEGSSVDISVSGADTYLWYPDINISTLTGPVVTVSPTVDMYYYADFVNACGIETDSVFLELVVASIHAFNDTIICPGQSANLWATGGVSYLWSPPAGLSSTTSSLISASPSTSTMYYLTGTDEHGCVSSDSVFVDLFPQPFIQTNPDVYAFIGDNIQLSAISTTSGQFVWSPVEFLSCVACVNPIANPDMNYTYTVSYVDQNGCSASDNVSIFYDPVIYVPNTFTPGGNADINNFFKAEGGNIQTFEMLIFDRWGELIYTITDLNDSWDGTYDGHDCQDGTYIWRVTITDFNDIQHEYTGHVNLLR